MFKTANLQKFFIDCFEIFTQHCIGIRECFLCYIRVTSLTSKSGVFFKPSKIDTLEIKSSIFRLFFFCIASSQMVIEINVENFNSIIDSIMIVRLIIFKNDKDDDC